MDEAKRHVIAGNGTIVEAGGVYLTYSGDEDTPNAVAKVVSVGGPDAAGWDCQIAPDGTRIASPELWLKLFYFRSVEAPREIPGPAEKFRIMPVSANMFLAWGPP